MNYKDCLIPIPKIVIYGVLNWGLGHATRSIPIIQYLINQGSEVILASDGDALLFLKKTFPSLHFESLHAYNIKYKHQTVEQSVFMALPNIIYAIRQEKATLKNLVKKHKPDLVISDSRFGFRHRDIRSIIITHQTNLISNRRLFRYFGNIGNGFLLNQFNECWIPDYKDVPLSGKLNRGIKSLKKVYIGPLSRLTKKVKEKDIDLLIILSGPEPKRTEFSNLVKQLLPISNKRVVAIEGKVGEKITTIQIDGVEWFNYMPSDKLNQYMNRSKLVLCRSGYSSIMDLVHLGIPAILVATPGQTEQVYLSELLNGKYGFNCIEESKLTKEFLQDCFDHV